MKASTKRKIRKVLSPIRRIGLKNKDFTIISNNCWGGVVYDIFGLKYMTPTVGCYMMSNDYIKFLSNLKYYLSLDCLPFEYAKSKYKSNERLRNVPIGLLGDIEIFFLHYDNIDDAINKWNKRRKRVNFNNLLVKYSDQNGFKKEDFDSFLRLDYKNKLFITANDSYKSQDCSICYLYEYKEIGYAKDDIKLSLKKIEIKKILNGLVD